MLADEAQGLGLTLGARLTPAISVAGQFGDVAEQLLAQGRRFLLLARCGCQRIKRQRG